MKNLFIKGRGLGHVTNFEFLGPLFIFKTVKDINLVFGTGAYMY